MPEKIKSNIKSPEIGDKDQEISGIVQSSKKWLSSLESELVNPSENSRRFLDCFDKLFEPLNFTKSGIKLSISGRQVGELVKWWNWYRELTMTKTSTETVKSKRDFPIWSVLGWSAWLLLGFIYSRWYDVEKIKKVSSFSLRRYADGSYMLVAWSQNIKLNEVEATKIINIFTDAITDWMKVQAEKRSRQISNIVNN